MFVVNGKRIEWKRFLIRCLWSRLASMPCSRNARLREACLRGAVMDRFVKQQRAALRPNPRPGPGARPRQTGNLWKEKCWRKYISLGRCRNSCRCLNQPWTASWCIGSTYEISHHATRAKCTKLFLFNFFFFVRFSARVFFLWTLAALPSL